MIEPLKIVDVFDRGIGGRECVSIRVQGFCDLGHYWLGLGLRQSNNQIFPINDNLFWLGRGNVNPGDWVYVYTGWGEPRIINLPGVAAKLFSLHWKRDTVLFGPNEIFPYLINAPFVGLSEKMESVQSGLINQSDK